MESHVFSCYLGVIAFAIGKIALASLMQLPCLLLMQLFPNRTRISVVLVWLYIIRFSFSKKASEEENLVLVIVS